MSKKWLGKNQGTNKKNIEKTTCTVLKNEQQKHLENRCFGPKMKRPSSQNHQFSGANCSFQGENLCISQFNVTTTTKKKRLPSCNLKPLHAFLRSNNASRKDHPKKKKHLPLNVASKKKKRSLDKICFPN